MSVVKGWSRRYFRRTRVEEIGKRKGMTLGCCVPMIQDQCDGVLLVHYSTDILFLS
jgi:hypothetical protein